MPPGLPASTAGLFPPRSVERAAQALGRPSYLSKDRRETWDNGYAASRITEHLPATATDIQIVELADRLGACILTQDLDFSALVAKSGKRGPSVVSLRVGNASPERISSLLLDILPTAEKELREGCIISVDETGLRIRPLPIG